MTWLLLGGAILCEVTGTLGLRIAAMGRRTFYPLVVVAYLFAFGFLSLALRHGMGLAVAYGIWSAVGVALTAIASRVVFKEPLTRLMLVGIAMVMGGVLCVELGQAG